MNESTRAPAAHRPAEHCDHTPDGGDPRPVFEMLADEYETVVYGHDAETELRAIIAIHSTALGPALGGLRFYPYVSESAALTDVLRLAKGMSYKAAAAGLDLGGGKAVVIGDPRTQKTPELFAAFARIVDRLGGAYITAADVGITSDDIDLIAQTTPYVGGSTAQSGDPSPMTAYGVWHAIRATAQELWGDPSLQGRHIAVQGVGKVGGSLVRHLANEGARLTIADVDVGAATRLAVETGADVVPTDEILTATCDILSPCALGAVLDDKTIPAIRARGVAGAANNQLARADHGELLRDSGILYAPDYVVNAGGLINIEDERHGYDPERARRKAAQIGDRLSDIFTRATREGISTAAAAQRIAVERIRSVRR